MRNFVNEKGKRAAKKRQKKDGRVNVLAILISVSMICSLMVPYAQFIEASSDLPNCGVAEHQHNASCYRLDNTPACGKAEGEDHTHTNACYDKVLACVKQEHTHMDACYSDKTADVEDPALWDAQFGTTALTKDTWAESLAAVAEQQVGYEESEDNYEVEKDGSHNGYTRYGDFADDKYGSWDTSFVNFCLEYAGIAKANVFPEEESTAKDFVKQFVKDDKENKEYVEDANEQTLEEGNLVVVKGNPEKGNDKTDTTLGIVTKVDKEEGTATVVEGDSHDQVEENEYDLDSKNLTQTIPVDKIENDLKEEEAAENQTPEGSGDQAEPDADSIQPEGDKAPEAADINKEEADKVDKTESDQETGNGEAAGEENPVGIQYICGITEEHTHGDACYDENGELTCKKEEHQHGFDCLKPAEGEEQPSEEAAEEEQPAEEPSEEPAQPDEEEAAAPESGYICGKEEHTHSDACYDDGTYNLSKPLFKLFTNREGEPELICGKEEHQHDDACLPEGEVEKKDEAGNEYFCGQKAHKHDETCLDENNQLACGLPEHEHDDSCLVEQKEEEPEYICGKKEHKHEASCYDEKGELTCKEEEHQHDDSCLKAEEEKPETQLIPIVKQFTQKVGAFNITFDIEGTAEVAAEKTDGNEPGNSDEAVTEDAAAGSDESTAPEEEIIADEDGNADLAPASEAKGTAKAGIREVLENVNEAVEESKEAAEDGTNTEKADAANDSDMEAGEAKEPAADSEGTTTEGTSGLNVEATLIDESSKTYKDFEKYAKENSDGAKRLLMQVLQLKASYNGEAIELDDCEIKATIASDSSLKDYIADTEDSEEQGILISVLGAAEDSQISNLGNKTIQKDELSTNESVQLMSISTTAKNVRLMAVRAEQEPNPEFTVQYYANLEQVAYNDVTLKETTSGSNTNELPVIDTSGKQLPSNGKGTAKSPNDNAIRNLYVDTKTNKLKTKKELTKVYSQRSFEYYKAPTLNYMNALVENPGYELKEVWVLKDGMNATSINRSDWDTYTYNSKLHFTNRKESAGIIDGETYVWIKPEATLRFVYDTTKNDKDFKATFYDYDIGDGKIYSSQQNAANSANGQNTSTQGTGTWYMKTNQQGINSAGNYTGTGTKLAFGNGNTGSGLQHENWSGNLLNKHNGTQTGHPSVNGSYKGCTFGLANKLVDGKIQYSNGVIVPKLFNEGDAAGKTTHDNYSLKFNRNGDTHTLTAVNGTGTGNLDSFNHPEPNTSTTHYHIWTNNFWPMDSASSFGTNGHDMKFGDYANRERYKFAGQAGSSGGSAAANGTFPWSDDGKDHNSYFGMHYTVEFDLEPEYEGPLNYYFFGDDDMWVFLDGELVCDIGGVHSSVGEYVDLWDYLKNDPNYLDKDSEPKKHTLNFFYTERGESGSTCWMQFTLPSVSSLTPEKVDKDYGQLKVEKQVVAEEDGEEVEYDTEQNFEFDIKLEDANGKHLKDHYSYIRYNADGTEDEEGHGLVVFDGAEFSLKPGQYIVVKYVPPGTKYIITEKTGVVRIGEATFGCDTDITIDGEKVMEDNIKIVNGEKLTTAGKVEKPNADGNIEKDDTSEVLYINKAILYKLPSTGGIGIYWYIISGILLMAGAALIVYKNRCREVLKR